MKRRSENREPLESTPSSSGDFDDLIDLINQNIDAWPARAPGSACVILAKHPGLVYRFNTPFLEKYVNSASEFDDDGVLAACCFEVLNGVLEDRKGWRNALFSVSNTLYKRFLAEYAGEVQDLIDAHLMPAVCVMKRDNKILFAIGIGGTTDDTEGAPAGVTLQ